jgi:hypothetical protein
MLTSPYVYAAVAAQHQADLRNEAAAGRLASRLLAQHRSARRQARSELQAARLEAELARRTVQPRAARVAH